MKIVCFILLFIPISISYGHPPVLSNSFRQIIPYTMNKPLSVKKKMKNLCFDASTIYNKLSVKACFRNDNINHMSSLPPFQQENFDLSIMDASSIFSFRDLFYSKTNVLLSPSTLFLDKWYDSIFFLTDPFNDAYFRHGIVVYKKLMEKVPVYEIDYQFDQHDNITSSSLMDIIRKHGSLDMASEKDLEKEETLSWKKLCLLFSDIYKVTNKLTFEYLTTKNKKTFNLYNEIKEEFKINGMAELLYTIEYTRTLQSNRNKIKRIAKKLSFESYFLGDPKTDLDEKKKLILNYLREGPVIASIVPLDYKTLIESRKRIPYTDVTLFGYSEETDHFMVLDHTKKNKHIWIKTTELVSRTCNIKRMIVNNEFANFWGSWKKIHEKICVLIVQRILEMVLSGL